MKTIIQIYDNKGKSFDRYTVIITTHYGVSVYGMSSNPHDPQGFNQFSSNDATNFDKAMIGKPVAFEYVPKEVQEAICNRLLSE